MNHSYSSNARAPRGRTTGPVLWWAALVFAAAWLTSPSGGDEAAPAAAPTTAPTTAAASPSPVRWPRSAPPAPAEVAAAEAFIRGVFREAFPPDAAVANGAPAKPEGRQRERDVNFGRRFLIQGTLAEADPAERFVLLRLARDFAGRGGDSATAMRAVRKLADLFNLPTLETRDSGLAALSAAADALASGDSAGSTEAVRDNARAFQQLIEAALAAGDYDLAARAVTAAKPVASRSRDVELQALLQSVSSGKGPEGDLFAGMEGERASAAKAMEKLRADPADAEANGVAGAFLCFGRADWQAGLPMLAKSASAAWKELATKDVAAEATGGSAAAAPLAEAWQQAARGRAGREREAALRRAAYWSLRAMPEMQGAALDAARRRVDALHDSSLRPGLLADLYDGDNLNSHRGTRIDPAIDFDWGEGSPDAHLGADRFSFCWQGFIKAPAPGLYELDVEADDGVIVRLEGRHVIDEWHTFDPRHYRAAVELTGATQAFEVMYFEITGAAFVHLRWKPPGAEQYFPVPASAFSHDPVWPWGPTALATRPRPAAALYVGPGGPGVWLRKYPDQLSWHAAQRHCEQMGGHLAWAPRPEDEQRLRKLAADWSVWLGGSDDEIENRWEWTNGVRIDPDVFDWWEGEPSGGRSENYLSILEGKGWNDSGGKMPFICQWDKP